MIKYTTKFEKRLKKRIIKSPGLRPKIIKQISLFEKDIHHPSLKVHKLKSKRAEEYSFWIEDNLRITFVIKNGYYLFTDVVDHDEY